MKKRKDNSPPPEVARVMHAIRGSNKITSVFKSVYGSARFVIVDSESLDHAQLANDWRYEWVGTYARTSPGTMMRNDLEEAYRG